MKLLIGVTMSSLILAFRHATLITFRFGEGLVGQMEAQGPRTSLLTIESVAIKAEALMQV